MSGGLAPIGFPAYETLRPVTDLAGVILCDNPSEMTFEGTNTVVLRAPGSPTWVVVDPGPDDLAHAERIAAIVGEIELVVVTHRHGDHTDGIDHLRTFTAAPVRAVQERFCRDAAPLVTGGDDDEVIHAAGLDIIVLGTPGHTADSVSLEVRVAGTGFTAPPDCVVLGDTILGRDSTVPGSIARAAARVRSRKSRRAASYDGTPATDPGSSSRSMYRPERSRRSRPRSTSFAVSRRSIPRAARSAGDRRAGGMWSFPDEWAMGSIVAPAASAPGPASWDYPGACGWLGPLWTTTIHPPSPPIRYSAARSAPRMRVADRAAE